jgi:hypothetical protein
LIRKATPLPLTLFAAAFFACLPGAASAQTQSSVPDSPLVKQLDRIDLSINGVGEYNTTVMGPIQPTAAPDAGQQVTQFGSNTLGALIGIRYVARPYVGFEFNYGYARYTENFTAAPYQIQTKVNEYTVGYVITPPHTLFGFQPFAAGGTGSIGFKPTPHGGQGAPEQARQVYYYSLGLQQDYASGHFGLRAGFRQLFFLDPDFGQNYLTILKHASTYEPMVGFYLRY